MAAKGGTQRDRERMRTAGIDCCGFILQTVP
jgi:hypothetical protein